MTPAGLAFGDAVEARLRAAATRLQAYDFKPWFYGDSIGFEGLVAASWLLDDARYRDFAHSFLLRWAVADEPPGPDDNTAPGLVLCRLAADDDDETLAAAAERLARFLDGRRQVAGAPVTFEDARRSLREPYGEGALDAADQALLADPGPGIYVDCLHFDPPFLAALADLRGEPERRSQAVAAAAGYVTLLQDEASGLFHHFWLERPARAYGLGWGRGQGWALLGLLDVIERLPLATDGRDTLVRATERLLAAMLARQLADGSWSAVAGVSASGPEASTAAFMVVGFRRALRLGLGDAHRLAAGADRAWAATLAALDASGLLCDVSAAVYSSTADQHYAAVPLGFDVPWGQGPLLVAAAEMARAR